MSFAQLLLNAVSVVSVNLILLCFCIAGRIEAKRAITPIPWLVVGTILYVAGYCGNIYYIINDGSYFHRDTLLVYEILLSLFLILVFFPRSIQIYKDKKQERIQKKAFNNPTEKLSTDSSYVPEKSGSSIQPTQQILSDTTNIITCKHCGKENFSESKFCRFCGEKLQKEALPEYCRFCGSKVIEGSRFCPNCGHSLEVE